MKGLMFIFLLLGVSCSPKMPKLDKKFEFCIKDDKYVKEKTCVEIELKEK